MAEKFKGAPTEFLAQLALANGVQCEPLADKRSEVVAKLEAAGIKLPKD